MQNQNSDTDPSNAQTARGQREIGQTDSMLYHVTAIANARPILEHGLKADEDGNIYLFSETPISPWCFGGKETVVAPCVNWELLADRIATCQLGLGDGYVVFAIDLDGVNGNLEPDPVAERVAPFHRVLRQHKIAPEYLKPLLVVKDSAMETGAARRSAQEVLDSLVDYWMFGSDEDEAIPTPHCESCWCSSPSLTVMRV